MVLMERTVFGSVVFPLVVFAVFAYPAWRLYRESHSIFPAVIPLLFGIVALLIGFQWTRNLVKYGGTPFMIVDSEGATLFYTKSASRNRFSWNELTGIVFTKSLIVHGNFTEGNAMIMKNVLLVILRGDLAIDGVVEVGKRFEVFDFGTNMLMYSPDRNAILYCLFLAPQKARMAINALRMYSGGKVPLEEKREVVIDYFTKRITSDPP